jgi:tetratricopeptide (TPR) repeat protein
MLEAYYGLLTAFDVNESQRDQQIAACVSALEVFPFDAQLLCAMGGYMQARGRIDLAERAYRAACRYGQIQPEAWHLPDVGELAAICLAVCLQLSGQIDESIRELGDALVRFPTADRIRVRLIDLYVQKGMEKEALQAVGKLRPGYVGKEAFRSAIRGACQATERNWISALSYLQTAHAAGCQEPLCFRWLTVTLLSLGSLDVAEGILSQWEIHEPKSVEIRQYRQVLQEVRNPEPTEIGGLGHKTPGPASDARQIRVDAADPTTGPHAFPTTGAVPPATSEESLL